MAPSSAFAPPPVCVQFQGTYIGNVLCVAEAKLMHPCKRARKQLNHNVESMTRSHVNSMCSNANMQDIQSIQNDCNTNKTRRTRGNHAAHADGIYSDGRCTGGGGCAGGGGCDDGGGRRCSLQSCNTGNGERRVGDGGTVQTAVLRLRWRRRLRWWPLLRWRRRLRCWRQLWICWHRAAGSIGAAGIGAAGGDRPEMRSRPEMRCRPEMRDQPETRAQLE